MVKQRKGVYYNKKQLAFRRATQEIKVFLGGRGSGKTTEMSIEIYDRVKDMPRGKFYLSSTTYNQLLTKTLPPIFEKWEEFGLIEDVHYVVGKKPPHWFKMPYKKPKKNFEYFIFFFNGFALELLSLDRPDKSRGGSYEGGLIDEAGLIKEEHFTKVLKFATRGNVKKFESPHLNQTSLYTSIPWKPSGQWILEFESKAKADPDSFFFLESTAWDNKDILGEDTIRGWEKTTPYLEFQIEVMNKRIQMAEDAFYHAFDPDKHGYQPKYIYGKGSRGLETKSVEDIDLNALLECTFDFSGWFNCVSVFQEKKNVERMVRSYSVTHEEGKIVALVDKFCNAHTNHKFKFVRIWGEPRGFDKNPIGDDLYTIIKKRFQLNGWQCEIKARRGKSDDHEIRHTFMNDIFAETNPLYPKFRANEEYCKDPMIALKMTEVLPNFKKDKSNEKDRKFNQAHAPHYTDGIDYYFMDKYYGKFSTGRRSGWFGTR